jgi:hypothetical protein
MGILFYILAVIGVVAVIILIAYVLVGLYIGYMISQIGK